MWVNTPGLSLSPPVYILSCHGNAELEAHWSTMEVSGRWGSAQVGGKSSKIRAGGGGGKGKHPLINNSAVKVKIK